MENTIKTTCPYCGVGCGILATPRADGSVSIQGDPDHPANYGRLCSKGSALGETLDHDDRLLFPVLHGQRASWDEALDKIANTFNKTIQQYGPDSVAFYLSGQILSEDYYVANKLMKGFIGSANIDTNSRLCMASSVAGHRRAFGADTVPGTYEDLEMADLVVLVGSNLAWCHPVIYQRIAAAKEKRPQMKIVLVDPRRTMTADIADLHLAIAPDGDVALFMGLLAHIARHGKLDQDYINAYTNDFPAALDAANMLPLGTIAAATGLSETALEEFYRLWATTQKTVTVYSQGVNQSVAGTDKVNAIINCHLATGRIGKAGAGPFSITGQPNAMGGREVGGLANMLAAHMDIENPVHRDRVKRFWKAPTIASKPGLKAVDMFDAIAEGRIKAIWIMATNPVVSMPNASAVEAALAACPFVVVSDMSKATDTIRHAHVKLPSLGWGEKDGTVTNSERRISRQRPFLSGPGEARPDWWQMAEVAQRMGFARAFDFANPAAIFKEYAAQTSFENSGMRDLDLGACAEIDQKTYDELPPFQWPQARGLDKEKDMRFFAKGGFFTPDRRARFIPVTTGTMPGNLNNPFVLNTGRIRDQWHTMTRTAKSSRLCQHIAEPFAEFHPLDAAALQIGDADLVRLFNENGAIVVRAHLTARQRKGSIFVPMHWSDQFSSNGRVDCLVQPVTDPFSGQPALKMARIKAERFDAAVYGFAVSAGRPDFSRTDYWATARADKGWRSEFSLNQSIEGMDDFACQFLALPANTPLLTYHDPKTHQTRIAAFAGDQLLGVVYLSSEPVALSRNLSRNWAVDLLQETFFDLSTRWRVVTGRPADNMPDKGAIICSCMNVGLNDIVQAVRSGCQTLEAIGMATTAGTNCGSCKSEIKQIIFENQVVAAE